MKELPEDVIRGVFRARQDTRGIKSGDIEGMNALKPDTLTDFCLYATNALQTRTVDAWAFVVPQCMLLYLQDTTRPIIKPIIKREKNKVAQFAFFSENTPPCFPQAKHV